MSERKRSFLIRDILADVNVDDHQPRDDKPPTIATSCLSEYSDRGMGHTGLICPQKSPFSHTAIACGNADLVTCFPSVSSLFRTVKVDRYELYELCRGQ